LGKAPFHDFRKNNSWQEFRMIKRNWNFSISLPPDYKDLFFNTVIMGSINLSFNSDTINVLLCAQPKSASLYLTQVLASCLNYENHQIGFDRMGGYLYYPRLLAAKFTRKNTISHCHEAPEPYIVKLIKALGLRPMVLTRNLLDALVSRRDMLLKDQWAGNILSPKAIDKFTAGSEEYQLDVIIDLFAAEYINFFVGWDLYRSDQKINPIYITYEQMIQNELELISSVAQKLNVSFEESHAANVIQKIRASGGINLNKGVVGRGRKKISDRQISYLRQLASKLGCDNENFLGFKISTQNQATIQDFKYMDTANALLS
jgi:hypothetical protein